MKFPVLRVQVLLAVVVAGLFVFHAVALAQRGGRVSLEDRVKMLTDNLSLSKEQSDSVMSIYKAAEQERMDIFEAHRGNRDEMRSLMQKHNEEVDAKISALLTAEQKEAFVKFRKERQGMMGGPRGGRPGNREQ